MGKTKIGIYCYFIADILTKLLQNSSLSGPLPNLSFLLKPLNLTWQLKGKICEKIFKNQLLRSHEGYKAETLNMTLASSKLLFLLPLLKLVAMVT